MATLERPSNTQYGGESNIRYSQTQNPNTGLTMDVMRS